MNDQDLRIQLEGLFADPNAEFEPEPGRTEPLLERTIVDLLKGEIEVESESEGEARAIATEPVATAPISTEPTMMEIPSPVPVQLLKDVAERDTEEPSSPQADFLAWEARLQTQRLKILNVMLGSLGGLGTVIIVFLLINLVQEPSQWFPVYISYFVAYAVLMTLAMARQLDLTVRATGLIVLAYGTGIAVLLTEGPLSGGGLYLLAAPLLSAMLIRQRAGVIMAVVSSLIYAGFLLADHLGWLHPSIPYNPSVLPSILSLIGTFVLITAGVTFTQWMFNQTLTSALREAEQKHAESVHARSLLEERAGELGKANALLQKRTFQLQTAAQVSGATTFSVLDPDELVQQVVDLIQDRFGLYHVGLFLIGDVGADADEAGADAGSTDASGQWVRLQAGTGEAGRQMLALDYKVQVDTSSTIGRCIVNAQAHIALDTDAVHLADSSEHVKAARLLPDTRSEMVLPLRSRGRVIGALTLHSTERDAFSQEDIPVLQTMADQIAVAIDNAQLYTEAQANLKKVEEVQRHYVREQWTEFMSAQATPIYERTQPGVTPLGDTALPEVEQAMAQQAAVVQSDMGSRTKPAALVVPISLRGEAVGALGLQETGSGRQWTDAEIALIEDVANQMALAIENARLLEETQQRAEQERIIANITARVRATMDPESILQTAVRELGAALGTDRAFVQLGASKQTTDK